jgi:ribosomal protein S18 acetylase RimI-like enzyme
MELRTATPDDLGELAALVAAQQADPTRHVGEYGPTATGIAEQLTELAPGGLDAVVVAIADAAIVGVLAAEWDEDPPRVWWLGPVVAPGTDWQQTADALYDHLRRRVPATVTEEEFGPDERHVELAAFAARRGFTAEEASVVLVRELPEADGSAGLPPDVSPARLRPFVEDDRAPVADLHDRLFPATHTPGGRLDEGRDRLVWVAELGGRLAGYVAAERQEDGTGYVDFLGVDPAAQGQGIGRHLVATACELLHDRHGCREVTLTVRVSNAPARRVYGRCGFVEERVLVPWRRGFSTARRTAS